MKGIEHHIDVVDRTIEETKEQLECYHDVISNCLENGKRH